MIGELPEENKRGRIIMNNRDPEIGAASGLIQVGIRTFDKVMKQILDLGQSSLSESQFMAFRKMAMDFFADGKRTFWEMQKGRCGQSKLMTEKAVLMDE